MKVQRHAVYRLFIDVDLPEAEQYDRPRYPESKLIYRVQRVTVTVITNDGDKTTTDVTFYGANVKKDGSLGAAYRDDAWGRKIDDIPESTRRAIQVEIDAWLAHVRGAHTVRVHTAV